MKTNRFVTLIVLIYLVVCFGACKKKDKPIQENVFYTCSMDPQVMERHPGICPICKMDLTKIILSPEEKLSKSIKLNQTQIDLANIKTDTVRLGEIYQEKTITGTMALNENNIIQINSRVAGRIEILHVKNIGENIHVGQALYEIYSEELISAQNEFLLLRNKKSTFNNKEFNYEGFINSARNKLLIWGMSEKQIETLQLDKVVHQRVPIFSHVAGVLTDIFFREGDYLEEGAGIFQLADNSSLWINAQLFPDELKFVRENDEVDIHVPAYPNETIKGKISFINPELLPGSKINLVRIQIENDQQRYKPGMMAYIVLKTERKRAFSVPLNAVIRNAKGSIIWIKSVEDKFDFRIVETGLENSDFVEITSGLQGNELIVISGSYLLNSEYVFKKGMDPMTKGFTH